MQAIHTLLDDPALTGREVLGIARIFFEMGRQNFENLNQMGDQTCSVASGNSQKEEASRGA